MKATIKEIKGVKEHVNDYGTTYYHALILDNGEKISIGKKKKDFFTVGQSIDYEITSEGKNGWKNAKTVSTFNKGYQKEAFEERAAGMAMAYAKDLVIGGKVELRDISKYADAMYGWMVKHKM